MFLNSLSGRFLLLTVVFVMLAEVLIFVPSVARFREDYLLARLERAQIASLALLATEDDMVSPSLAEELLRNAGVFNVALRRDVVRELILSSDMPMSVSRTFDLRDTTALELIRDALAQLGNTEPGVIRVIGEPLRDAGMLIEVTLPTEPLRAAMIDYGLRILMLSLVISVITSALLFLAVRRFMVAPIRRVISHMKAYEAAPDDARQIIRPEATIHELREAEEALRSMQTELSHALRQKDRLAALGGAVAKISHDLRNMLTTTQLLADRIEQSDDPAVKRTAPKVMASLSRAMRLCETTLAFGRAEEPTPELGRVALGRLVEDVIENEKLAAETDLVRFVTDLPPGAALHVDHEQVFRVLSNLVRNARQAIETSGQAGEITISARSENGDCVIELRDTGPGLPARAVENIFKPFQSTTRKGGSGLGLAIAAELVRGHGGKLELVSTGETGTVFAIRLPQAD
ncbi:sensor histidine kinase [Maritimibacter sp. 55A14]|uniref:sensor histidine kinase n=1 Tax=Maritimibacter sp. 55A14 TaxID=2174844 RepID=UPI000D612553|nr:HAMP domain-containing sensor histidine kinase [Maritimibacter sp. 55A14]PWE32742.1 sensor histidine kinase [Maritimibacter sp. 55A14]